MYFVLWKSDIVCIYEIRSSHRIANCVGKYIRNIFENKLAIHRLWDDKGEKGRLTKVFAKALEIMKSYKFQVVVQKIKELEGKLLTFTIY